MLKNQNSIDLNPFNSRYDEILIRANDTATVLPGALVEFRDELNDNYRGGYITKKYNEGVATNPYTVVEQKVTDRITVLYKGTPFEQVKHDTTYTTEKKECTLDNFDIGKFAPAVVLENSLIGNSLNHKNKQDNVSRCRRLVPGDKFLLRAVAGSYVYGDPLYAIQTDNGIYVTKEEGGMFIGWSEEEYTITDDMVDLVDTYEFPVITDSLRGKLVNLLAVRIGVAHKVLVLPSIEGLSFSTPSTAPNSYTGNTYSASDFVGITGTQSGDEITYVIENLTTGTVVGSIKGSGDYKITITVKREGYKPVKEIRYVTVEKKQLTVTGTSVENKEYDGTTNANVVLGTVSGIQQGDSFELIATGKFDNADVGTGKTVTVVYTVPLAYAGNYLAPASETLTADILAVEVEPIELEIEAVQIATKVYDATKNATATVVLRNIGSDDVVVTCDAEFASERARDDAVVYLSNFVLSGADSELYKLPATLPTQTTGTIEKAILRVNGTTVTSRPVNGSTDISENVVVGSIEGIMEDDTVTVRVLSATLNNPEEGNRIATVTYIPYGVVAYNYIVPQTDKINVYIGSKIDYTIIANGSLNPPVSTTELTLRFNEDPGTIPNSFITLGGDVLKLTNEDYVPVLNDGKYEITIPVKRTGTTATGRDNLNVMVIGVPTVVPTGKLVETYAVKSYWGIYPCQFSGTTEPTAEQILSMVNNNAAISEIPTFNSPLHNNAELYGLVCNFSLNETDWNKAIADNNASDPSSGFDEDDLDFETGSGYEFILYGWNEITGVTVENGVGINQTNGFKEFALEINGVPYRGLVSKLPNRPSAVGDNSNPTFYFIFSKD